MRSLRRVVEAQRFIARKSSQRCPSHLAAFRIGALKWMHGRVV